MTGNRKKKPKKNKSVYNIDISAPALWHWGKGLRVWADNVLKRLVHKLSNVFVQIIQPLLVQAWW